MVALTGWCHLKQLLMLQYEIWHVLKMSFRIIPSKNSILLGANNCKVYWSSKRKILFENYKAKIPQRLDIRFLRFCIGLWRPVWNTYPVYRTSFNCYLESNQKQWLHAENFRDKHPYLQHLLHDCNRISYNILMLMSNYWIKCFQICM